MVSSSFIVVFKTELRSADSGDSDLPETAFSSSAPYALTCVRLFDSSVRFSVVEHKVKRSSLIGLLQHPAQLPHCV